MARFVWHDRRYFAHNRCGELFLTNYISSDFGDVEVESPTLRVEMNYVQGQR